jgi:opacity protein-like surface antigen
MNRAVWFVAGFLYAAGAAAADTSAAAPVEGERSQSSTAAALPQRPERHVIVMPTVGMWHYPFKQSGWTAKPGPVWGLDVKIEPWRWLGVRASVLRGNQELELDASVPKPAATDFYQPMLEITRLQLRAEPTLQLTNALSTYVGVGVGWGRLVAPEAITTPRLHTYERTGVHLAYEGALGIAYEPRADLIVLDLSLAGSLLTRETGTAYDPVQAFSDAGHRTTLGGLSHFSYTYRAMFGVGLIL